MLAFLASSFSYNGVSNGDCFLGGVALLIGLYNDWHRFDSANRHINIRKSVLGVLKQITNLKSGNSIDAFSAKLSVSNPAVFPSIYSLYRRSVLLLHFLSARLLFIAGQKSFIGACLSQVKSCLSRLF